MNYSIMSSFEAACAEMLGWSSSTKPSSSSSSSSPPTPIPKTGGQPKLGGAAVGRFAPEFDGLNCFETLISSTPSTE